VPDPAVVAGVVVVMAVAKNQALAIAVTGAWLLLGAASSAQAPPPAVGASGPVLPAFPDRPDPKLRYVVYLHGRIVEEQGRKAVSPEFGAYRYDEIVAALARRGNAVIAEIREKDADAQRSAAHVVQGVQRLLGAGVPARNVTVVGASKGAAIAMLASTALAQPDVGWVILSNCNEWVTKNFEIALHGQVLSIYEESDEMGRSCAPIFERSPELAGGDEVRVSTGLRHGYLYRPLPEWVDPVLAWIERRERK
jgi:hypothetical protein